MKPSESFDLNNLNLKKGGGQDDPVLNSRASLVSYQQSHKETDTEKPHNDYNDAVSITDLNTTQRSKSIDSKMYTNGLKSNFARKYKNYSMNGEFMLNTKRISYQSNQGSA